MTRKIRSDFNLRCLLDLTHDSATSEQVKSCIRDVIDHAAGTRGNRALLDLLTFAIRQAETAGEAETATRLDDALGYATGRVLSVDIESKYQLLSSSSDNPARPHRRGYDPRRHGGSPAPSSARTGPADHRASVQLRTANSGHAQRIVVAVRRGPHRRVFATPAQHWAGGRRPCHPSGRCPAPSGAETS